MRRDPTLERMHGQRFDVAVIGGGINGAVSAAALSAQGASVVLVERDDFASGTSQESSNLIWGGIKYLQTYEIPLVWALCRSRNELMRAYPTRIREMPFLAALGQTAPFSIGLGAVGVGAYWALGRGRTAAPKAFSTARLRKMEPLVSTAGLRGALQYHDGLLVDNDSRFVWDFIRQAGRRGAITANYVELCGAERSAAGWRLALHDRVADGDLHVYADAVVNAAGPEVADIGALVATRTRHRLALSKGVHLVVPRQGDSDRVLAFFDDEQRLFYVIPMHDRWVIGTTDTRVATPNPGVDDADRQFILDQANRRLELARPLTQADIISERCGVRSLVIDDDEVTTEDWMALSRRHAVEMDAEHRVISILGGKLTDCLNVGAKVTQLIGQLGISLGSGEGWHGEEGDRVRRDVWAMGHSVASRMNGSRPQHSALEARLDSLWRRQGSAGLPVIDSWQQDPANAEPLFAGTDITRGEFAVMARTEMAVTTDDLLRRRTPVGLIRTADELAAHGAMDELTSMLGEATGRPVPAAPRPAAAHDFEER